MRPLPVKTLFAHYAPYQEFVKHPEQFLDEDTVVPIGPLGLVDKLATNEHGNYIVIDFVIHPHIGAYTKTFKQKFKKPIGWQSVETNVTKRVEEFLKYAAVHTSSIHVGIEGETEDGFLACIAIVESPTGADITAFQRCIQSRLEEDDCMHYKCRDPNNKRYITMQVGGFLMSTLQGGNWGLHDWGSVAQRVTQNFNCSTCN